MGKPNDYYIRIFGQTSGKPEVGESVTIIATEVVISGHSGEKDRIIKRPKKMAKFFEMPIPEKGKPFSFVFSKVEEIVADDSDNGRVIVIGDDGPKKTFTFTKFSPDHGKVYDDSEERRFFAVAVVKK